MSFPKDDEILLWKMFKSTFLKKKKMYVLSICIYNLCTMILIKFQYDFNLMTLPQPFKISNKMAYGQLFSYTIRYTLNISLKFNLTRYNARTCTCSF